MNSTSCWQRSWTATIWWIVSCFTKRFCFFSNSMIYALAFFTVIFPIKSIFSLIVPSARITSLDVNLCFWYHSTSAESPNDAHITTPVPLSIATVSSARIGISKSYNGTIAFWPINFLYRVSSGWTKMQAHPASSSGLVVAIKRLPIGVVKFR